MRILFVLDGLFMGGAERNTAQLMRALAEMGNDVHLCVLRCPSPGEAERAGFAPGAGRLTTLGVRRIYDPRGFVRFSTLLRRLQPDCIHVQDPYGNLLALWARYIHGVRSVMTRHVAGDETTTRWSRLRLLILRWAARRAFDKVVLVADALRDGFCRDYAWNEEDTLTIHNGVALPSLDAGLRHDVRTELGWGRDTPIILMVAVFRRGKGHDVLVQAFRDALASQPAARLVFAGDGPLRSEFEGLAGDLGASCKFLGERHDVNRLMQAADVLVLPSESEALPTVLLEAAAAGCPAIATNVGGVSEIIEDGVTGRLVPPRDRVALAAALSRLIADAGLRRDMGAAARANAEREFSIAVQARKTSDLYLQICAKA